ncbi:MAG: zinc-ribbon domain-containing protein [Deltaproteobacteria bacterium]|nr:zinc-ribbon domain-containing protein [Deltaproteobacteria bacterium]
MLVTCPKCLEQLQFKGTAESLPPDSWFRCPHCSERFRPPGRIWDLGPDSLAGRRPTLASRPAFLGPGPVSYRRAPDSVLHHVPLSGRTSRWRGRQLPVVAAVFLAVSLAMAWAFHSSAPPPHAHTAPAELRPRAPAVEYGGRRLVEDLLFLKRKIQLTGKTNYSVAYRGVEYRLVRHFLDRLAPDACPAFSSIDIWSMRTRDGFQATSLCGQKQPPLTLVVKWTTEVANVSVAGVDGGVSLDLAAVQPQN